LRAFLKGAEGAGIQLQNIQASVVHLEILDETQFGLHSLAPNLLENLATFKLALQVVS